MLSATAASCLILHLVIAWLLNMRIDLSALFFHSAGVEISKFFIKFAEP